MCFARFLNCFTMREARPFNRMTCTIISYGLTFLPVIFVLVWIFDGMLGDGAGGDPAFLSKRGLAAHFGEEIVDPTTGAFSYPFKWKVFNWHPLLMTLGFVTLYTQAALHFRLLPFSHDTNKLIHFATQTVAMIVTSTAIAVIHRFKLHNYQGFEFYNPHGWIGITVYALFALQYVHGAFYFLLPKAVVPVADRKAYKPYHMWAGLWIYCGTAMAVVSGLAGYSWIFDGVEVPSTPPYRWPGVIALSVLVCAGVVAFHFMPTGLPPDSGNGQRGDMGQEALLGNGDVAGGNSTGTPQGPSYRAMQPANAF